MADSSDSALPEAITALLEQGSEVLSLRLTFKPTLPDLRLPPSHEMHLNPACAAFKARHTSQPCIDFDILRTPTEVMGLPEGRIHECPAGFTEIAVPVTSEGVQVGVLFAGPCWTRPGRKPSRWLPRVKDLSWLESRRQVCRALAGRLGAMIAGESSAGAPADRRQAILRFVESNLAEPLTLDDLAADLALSPSRTSHVVRQVTGRTFPRLLSDVRLRHAAHLLSRTDLPVGDVAYRVGLADQSYFSRLFKRRYRMTPTAYRRAHPRPGPGDGG